MNDEKECRWLEQFRNLKEIYDLREKELDNVIHDCQLIRDEWKIIHAVDFDIIHEFASSPKISVDREKKLKDEAINCARAFVFSKIEEVEIPILLPSFMAELRDHLSYLSFSQKKFLDAREKDQDKNDQETKYRDLLTDEENQLITKANEWYEQNEESASLPQEYMDRLIKIIESNFFDFYSLMKLQEEAKIIVRLIKEKRIQYFTDIFGDRSDIMQLIGEVMNSNVRKIIWYEEFRKIRPGLSKTISNIHDAKAIEIVIRLNKFFEERGEKCLVLLLSDAKSMEKVLNRDIADEKPEAQLGVFFLRTSKAFLAYMLNEGEDINETFEKLHKEKKRINEFKTLEGILKHAATDCDFECQKGLERLPSCQRAEKGLKTHIKNYETMFVDKIIEKRRKLFGTQSMAELRMEVDPHIKEFVKFLLQERPDFERRIREEYEKLETEMDHVFDNIKDNLIGLIGFSSLRRLTYKIRRFWGIPYKIYFKDKRINEAVNSLFRSITVAIDNKNQENIQNVRNRLNDLLSFTKETSLGAERNLLLGTLFFCYKYYSLASQLAREQLLDKSLDPEIRRELLLIECLSYLKLYKLRKTRYFLRRAEETYEGDNHWKDTRFENLRGIISLQTGDSDKTIKYLHNGIKLLRESNMDQDDKRALRSVLLNNWIYCLSKPAIPQMRDIKRAKGLMKILEKTWPESKWGPEFYHTKAYLLLKESLLIKEESEKEKILTAAERLFKKALELAYEYDLDEYEIVEMEQHLRSCERDIELLSGNKTQ